MVDTLLAGKQVTHSTDEIMMLGQDYMNKMSYFMTAIIRHFEISELMLNKLVSHNTPIFINLQNAVFYYGTEDMRTYQEQVEAVELSNDYVNRVLEDYSDIPVPK